MLSQAEIAFTHKTKRSKVCVIDEGADEIDMVISRGKLLEGNYNAFSMKLQQLKIFVKTTI